MLRGFCLIKVVDIWRNLFYNEVDKMIKLGMEWAVMKLTPIKKILLAIAAVCVAVTMITTNNIMAVMMVKVSRDMKAQQSVQANQQNDQDSESADDSYDDGADLGDSGDGDVADQGADGSVDAGNNGGAGDADANTGDANTGDANTGDTNTGDTNTEDADKGDANTGNAGNTNADKKPDNKPGSTASKKPTTKAEIAQYYKTAMNKAKTQSKSVVRVKDGAINYKNKVVAGKLSSIAESLMGMFMAKDAASIEVKNEAWEAKKLPPENAKCNLTANGIKSATCVEKGNYYIITIVAKNAKNPKAGSDGVGSIASVIQEETITGAIGSVPGLTLSNISLAYENVKVVATIEKATGNMVALSLDAPCYLSLDAKVPLLGSIDDACVGIEIITEYKMTY